MKTPHPTVSGWPAVRTAQDPIAKSAVNTLILVAYDLALCLGYARLFKINAENVADALSGVLPTAMGMQACPYVINRVRSINSNCIHLPYFVETQTGTDSVLAVADLFQFRMDMWACKIALYESYMQSLRKRETYEEKYVRLVDELQEALRSFDDTLKSLIPAVRNFIRAELLKNWHNKLNDTYKQYLPWWLDEQQLGL